MTGTDLIYIKFCIEFQSTICESRLCNLFQADACQEIKMDISLLERKSPNEVGEEDTLNTFYIFKCSGETKIQVLPSHDNFINFSSAESLTWHASVSLKVKLPRTAEVFAFYNF